jgi:hypothetical protein
MPLVRDREQFEFERFDGVYFWMRDDAEPILCKVSNKALRDQNVRDGGDADLAATFVRHRLRIEVIAGAKYQEGHRKNDLILILSKDLTPLSV